MKYYGTDNRNDITQLKNHLATSQAKLLQHQELEDRYDKAKLLAEIHAQLGECITTINNFQQIKL